MATASKRTARNELLDVKKRNRSQSNDDNLIEKLDKGGRRLGGMHPIFLQLIVLKDSQCHMSERKLAIGSGPKKCPQRVKGPGMILHPKLYLMFTSFKRWIQSNLCFSVIHDC